MVVQIRIWSISYQKKNSSSREIFFIYKNCNVYFNSKKRASNLPLVRRMLRCEKSREGLSYVQERIYRR